jgi:hypothetical protein
MYVPTGSSSNQTQTGQHNGDQPPQSQGWGSWISGFANKILAGGQASTKNLARGVTSVSSTLKDGVSAVAIGGASKIGGACNRIGGIYNAGIIPSVLDSHSTYDPDQKNIILQLEDELADNAWTQQLGQWVNAHVSYGIDQLIISQEESKFIELIKKEKFLLQGTLHANVLQILINLAKNIRAKNPEMILRPDKFIEQVLQQIGKESLTKDNTLNIDKAAERILNSAFPGGASDIILPSSKVHLPEFLQRRLIYYPIKWTIASLVKQSIETVAKQSQLHKENIKTLESYGSGTELLELCHVLTGSFSKLVKDFIGSKSKELNPELGKVARHIGEEEAGPVTGLLDNMGTYVGQIIVHALAHAVKAQQPGDQRHVLTVIAETFFAKVTGFFKQEGPELSRDFAEYEEKIRKNSPDAALVAERIKVKLIDLSDDLLSNLGIDPKGLAQLFPDKFNGLLVRKLIPDGTVSGEIYKPLQNKMTDLLFDYYQKVIFVQEKELPHQERFYKYDESVKILDTLLDDIIPTANQAVSNNGNDIGKSLLEWIHEHLIDNPQAGAPGVDASFFETPLKELLKSKLLPQINQFEHGYIRHLLLTLMSNLALQNEQALKNGKPVDNEKPVDLVAGGVQQLLAVAAKHINYPKLFKSLTQWKQFEKDAKGKEDLQKELEKWKADLQKTFIPCAKEILKQGRLDQQLKPQLKTFLEETALPKLLFLIFSDMTLLGNLTGLTDLDKARFKNEARIDTVAAGLVRKAMPSIQNLVDQYSSLMAQKLNENSGKSKLNSNEEAVFAGNLNKIFTDKSSENEQIWNGAQTFFSSLIALALKRLSLAYRRDDQEDALSNAIMRIRERVSEQKLDPKLVNKLMHYRTHIEPLKKLENEIEKLKTSAFKLVKMQKSATEEYKELVKAIEKKTTERCHYFLSLHKDVRNEKEALLISNIEAINNLLNNDNLAQKNVIYQMMLKKDLKHLKDQVKQQENDLENAEDDQKENAKSKLENLAKDYQRKQLDYDIAANLDAVQTQPAHLSNLLRQYRDEKFVELGQISSVNKEYTHLLEQFQPLTVQLMADMGFKKPSDLPVPFFLRSTLWDTLRNNILPEMFLDLYRFAWIPFSKEPAGKELDAVAKGGLAKIRQISHDQKDTLPKILARQMQQQKIEGLDEAWFKDWLHRLSDENPLNNETWPLLTEFSLRRLEHLNLSPEAVSVLLTKLEELFQNEGPNPKIDDAMTAYDAMPDGAEKEKHKLKLAKKLFGGLVEDILNISGLDNKHTYGIAYAGDVLIDSVREQLLNACFETKKPCFQLLSNKQKLKEQLQKEVDLQQGNKVEDIVHQIDLMLGIFGESIEDRVEKSLADPKVKGKVSMQLIDALGISHDSVKMLKKWFGNPIQEVISSRQMKNIMSQLPEMVKAVVLNKLVRLSKTNGMPIKTDKNASPLKHLPANIAIKMLNAIEMHRVKLKEALNKAMKESPNISEKELQVKLKPVSLQIVDALFATLEMQPKEDFALPFAEQIWENFGKDIVTDMLTKAYIDMTSTYRERKLHIQNLDERFADKIPEGQQHTRLVDAIKGKKEAGSNTRTGGYVGFIENYLKHKMQIHTPGIDGAIDEVWKYFGSKSKKGEKVHDYIDENHQAIKDWVIKDNLAKIAKANTSPDALGVKNVLFGGIKKDVSAMMLKIFDNVTGNLEHLEKKKPGQFFNIALDLMEIVSEHLTLVNTITKTQKKSHMHEVDKVLMTSEFEKQGKLHPSMPAADWLNRIKLVENLVKNAEKDVDAAKTKTPEERQRAAKALKNAKGSLKNIEETLAAQFKDNMGLKLTDYFLKLAGINGPDDLPVPAESRLMVWDALKNSLGPEIVFSLFGEALAPKMLNASLLSLFRLINQNVVTALEDQVPAAKKEARRKLNDAKQPPLEGGEILLNTADTKEQASVKKRQERCQKLITSLVQAVPSTLLGSLSVFDKTFNLEILNSLAPEKIEKVLRDSIQKWTATSVVEAASVYAAEHLPEKKLPTTEEEIQKAQEAEEEENDKTEQAISKEVSAIAASARKSFWVWLELKWIGLQSAVDIWIAKHDVGGIFLKLKSSLDEVFHLIFFDYIGMWITLLIGVPVDFLHVLYLKHKINWDAENIRKIVVETDINRNVILQASDRLMKEFPA